MNVKNVRTVFSRPWLQEHALDIAAYAGLALCLLIFTVLPPALAGVSIWDPGPFKALVRHVAVYAILSTGAVFVYSLGYMDISIGAQLSMYALLMILSNQNLGSIWPGVAASVVITVLCGIVNGAVAVALRMPSIITSLFLQFIIYGFNIVIIQTLGGGQFISMTVSGSWLEKLREPVVLIPIIASIALVVWYLFRFTKIGKYTKAIGANEEFVRQAGVQTVKYKLAAYLILGLCTVAAALVYVGLNGTADSKAGNGMEMIVMLCLILGGMPLSGGMKSKTSSAIVGAVTYTLITDGLQYLRIEARMINLFVAMIFVAVVLFTCRKDGRLLPK